MKTLFILSQYGTSFPFKQREGFIGSKESFPDLILYAIHHLETMLMENALLRAHKYNIISNDIELYNNYRNYSPTQFTEFVQTNYSNERIEQLMKEFTPKQGASLLKFFLIPKGKFEVNEPGVYALKISAVRMI